MFSYCLSALFCCLCTNRVGSHTAMDSGGAAYYIGDVVGGGGAATYYVEDVIGGRSLCFYACFLMFGLGMRCFIFRCVHPCFQVASFSRIQSLKRHSQHTFPSRVPIFRPAARVHLAWPSLRRHRRSEYSDHRLRKGRYRYNIGLVTGSRLILVIYQ